MKGHFILLGAWLAASCQNQVGPPGPAASAPHAPVAVEVSRALRRDVDRTLDLPADVKARRRAQVYSKVSGYLKELRVDIGDRVRAGQVVAVLDSPELDREATGMRAQVARSQAEALSLRSQQGSQSSLLSALSAETQKAHHQVGTARAEVAQTEARLRFNQDSYRRIRAVYVEDPGLIARQQLEQAWSQVKLAEGQVAAARQNLRAAQEQALSQQRRQESAGLEVQALASQEQAARQLVEARQQEAFKAQDWQDYLTLRAPFTGVVTTRNFDVGALIQAQPVLEIMDDSVVTVAVRVPELDVARVRPGRKVEVTAEALPEETFEGRVTRVAQALQASDRTMLAEIDLPNANRKLQPGMFVRCRLVLETHPGVVAVPTAAVLDEKGKTSVFQVEAGKAAKKPVKVGFSNPRWSEIQEGLSGTSPMVVTRGKETLTDGAPVTVTEASEGPKR